jgi:quercetin dioxygenase-like cupin family protein
MAIAKGASIFEKHVGVPTETAPLNPYSAAPKQVRAWLKSADDACQMCGVEDGRASFAPQEIASLQSLRRGVFAARAIRAGETIHPSDPDIFLAIPTVSGQVTANDLSKYMKFQATVDIAAHQPVLFSQTRQVDQRDKVYAIVQRINTMIQEAGVVVPGQAEFEISHHFGIDRFEETGAAIISLVNREYCKKLIVLLPGQSHPEHYHKLKEETFLVLRGDISIDLNGTRKECTSGCILVVERGARHSFRTRGGVIMEEISSTHHRGDSYYTDPAIEPVERRKTLIAYWLGASEPPVEHRAVA